MDLFRNIVLVGAGSFVGGTLRYGVSLLFRTDLAFPWPTFAVNMVGCLLIGLIIGWSSRLSEDWTLLLMVGLCGGFTTFSTFSKESLLLLQNNAYAMFILYILGSVLFGISLVALGWWITKS